MSLLEINEGSFEKEILKSKQTVLVDFWAAWCGPCQALSPILEEVSKEYKNKIKIYKLNIDKNQKIATKYHILSIPTILFFKEGKVVGQLTGVRSSADIKKQINKLC